MYRSSYLVFSKKGTFGDEPDEVNQTRTFEADLRVLGFLILLIEEVSKALDADSDRCRVADRLDPVGQITGFVPAELWVDRSVLRTVCGENDRISRDYVSREEIMLHPVVAVHWYD